jgi:hypothetical protein
VHCITVAHLGQCNLCQDMPMSLTVDRTESTSKATDATSTAAKAVQRMCSHVAQSQLHWDLTDVCCTVLQLELAMASASTDPPSVGHHMHLGTCHAFEAWLCTYLLAATTVVCRPCDTCQVSRLDTRKQHFQFIAEPVTHQRPFTGRKYNLP